jgi:Na+/H+ antiporter NhaC
VVPVPRADRLTPIADGGIPAIITPVTDDIERAPLTFHAGTLGATAPFILFLAGVTWLALSGAPDERGFWPVLLAALTLGLLLARDRTRYAEVVLEGMSQPIVMVMIMAWLLSGVLGAILAASGFVQALVWLARTAGLHGAGYVAAAFLACAMISTSTGTSFGTLLVAGPLLYPVAGAVGAGPAALAGAILAGSTFGDSISPISDTTIASSGTQGADIAGTVRSRLKYVIPAGLVALVASALLAGTATTSTTTATFPDGGSPRALVMFAIPVLVIALLAARRHLLEGLLFGILGAAVLALVAGLLEPRELLHIDRAAFGAKGVIVDGMSRGVGASILTIMLVGLVAGLQATGVVDRLVRRVARPGSSPRAAEVSIFAAVSAAVLLTTHSVVAMLAVGDVTRRVGGAAGISAYRRANLLDMTVCTYPFLLPYCIPTILAASTTSSGETFGVPRVSPVVVGLFNTYSWALLATVIVAIVTGYGRGEGTSRAVTPLEH